MLMTELMNNYYKIKQSQPLVFKQIYDPVSLTTSALELLNSYKSTESRSKPTVDSTLVGLLTLVKDLL